MPSALKRKKVRKQLQLSQLHPSTSELQKVPGADCDTCPLKRRKCIPPELASNPVIYWVGESPAKEELAQGRPFTGPSGQILRGTAELLDLPGPQSYDNVVSCFGFATLDDSQKIAAAEHCAPSLIRRLIEAKMAADDKVIVALGNTSKNVVVTGERRGVRTIAGEILVGEYGNVIPIIHPASILYEDSMLPIFNEHINEVRLFFSEAPAQVEDEIMKDLPGIQRMIETLKSDDLVALDLETTSFNAYETGTEWLEDGSGTFELGRVICLMLCGDSNKSYIIPVELLEEEEGVFEALKEFLENANILCHNGEFDLPFMLEMGIDVKLAEDTILQSYSMDEHPFHGLKKLTRMEFGVEDWSKILKQYIPKSRVSYANIPRPVLYSYGGLDTTYDRRLFSAQSARMTSDDQRIYRRLLDWSNMFTRIKHRGILIDIPRLMSLKQEWEQRYSELLDDFRPYNITGPMQGAKQAKMLKALGANPDYVDYYLTDIHGLMLYEQEFIDDQNTEGEAFVANLIEWRELEKALNTYLTDVARHTSYKDLAVHPGHKLFGTVTGRLVIQNPTLLNYPIHTRLAQQLREVFIPRPGYVWAHYDQKQFELRVYAAIADDKKMKEVFRQNRDPHDETGRNILGDEYVAEEHRGWIKTAVFGRLYGRGPSALSEEHGVPMAQAEAWSQQIDDFWDNLPQYRDWVEAEIMEHQKLVNPLGRTRRWPIITWENKHRVFDQGYNFPVQSTANDLNLQGQHDLYERYWETGLCYPLFPFHDAVDFEIREDKVEEVDEEIKAVMASVPARVLGVSDIVFKTDSQIGKNWGEAS